MNNPDPMQNYRGLCDELYALALEENRYLKEQRRPPSPEMNARKRALLARLEEALAELRATPRGRPLAGVTRAAIEYAKARMLQFLHLDRENEQLLMRCSLSSPSAVPAEVQTGAFHLHRAYQTGP
jgi:hypothetical protein